MADAPRAEHRECACRALHASAAICFGTGLTPPRVAPDPSRACHGPARAVFSFRNTVAATKFAISVPAATMTQVDRAAKRLGVTRSRYIAVILDRVARRERDAAISKAVDRVLAELDGQDLGSVEHLRAARHDAGTEW